jgi:hypothetical protein
MIRHPIHRDARSANATHNAREIFEQLFLEGRRNKILPLLRAEDDMIEKLRVSSGHPRPSTQSDVAATRLKIFVTLLSVGLHPRLSHPAAPRLQSAYHAAIRAAEKL